MPFPWRKLPADPCALTGRPTGELFRRLWVAVDPTWAQRSDAEVFDAGLPGPDELPPERRLAFEGERSEWLSETTAEDIGRLLKGIWEGAVASRGSCDEMLGELRGTCRQGERRGPAPIPGLLAESAQQIAGRSGLALTGVVSAGMLRAQMYNYRLTRRLTSAAGGSVEAAHKTGDFPPFAANDVALLEHAGGPSVVSVFTNQNRGDYWALEGVLGEVGEAVVGAWAEGQAPRWGLAKQ